MTDNDILHIIKQEESETLEFKSSFNREAIETLVAFSNTRGGKLLIGVKNDHTITGVDIEDETIQQWINEIKQNHEL